jgi:predicted DNA-binding ribbon-helix-helix protein
VKSRRIGIQDRQTSIRLEPEFWFYLRQIAAECGMTTKAFIEAVALSKNPSRPLSSALRVSVAAYLHGNPYPVYRVHGRMVPTRDGGVYLAARGKCRKPSKGPTPAR